MNSWMLIKTYPNIHLSIKKVSWNNDKYMELEKLIANTLRRKMINKSQKEHTPLKGMDQIR